MEAQTAGMGHNRPPVTETFKMANDYLADDLKADTKAKVDESAKLIKQAGTIPNEITNDRDQETLTALVNEIDKTINAMEVQRKDIKRPLLDAAGIIDSHFKAISAPLAAVRVPLAKRSTDYLVGKERRERERLAAEAARKEQEAAEAKRAAEAAKAEAKSVTDDVVATAMASVADDVVAEAEKAAKAAEATTGELTRVKTAAGGSSGLKTIWKATSFKVADMNYNDLKPFLSDKDIDAALARAVKAGIRQLAGVKIEEVPETSFRR